MSRSAVRPCISGPLSSYLPLRILVSLPLLLSCASPPAVPDGVVSWELTGGRWFDGRGFVARDMWMVGGTLVEARPERVDSTLDLSGEWVVPPFGDAHTHNLDGAFGLSDMRAAYREEGTFYVQVTRGAAAVRDTFKVPGSLDVRYANAGFTSTLGHPFLAYEPRAIGIFTAKAGRERAEELCQSRTMLGQAYWFVDSPAVLDAYWPRWLEGNPDVLKIFVLHSENDDAGAPCGERMGHRGLRPDLVPEIVERAHAAGLRVWAHVETVGDLEIVLRAGVDGLAHMPGYQMGPEEQAGHTGLFLEAANGTRFVGSPTAGANGEITSITLPGAITVGFTGQAVRFPDGRPLQRVGLVPHLEARPTVAGIRAGRDEVLEAALRLLGEG